MMIGRQWGITLGRRQKVRPHLGNGNGMRAYIGRADAERMYSNLIRVHQAEDGCMTIRIEKGFLYPHEAESLVEALCTLLDRRAEEKKERQQAWLAKTADTLEYEGFAVDLSRNQVQAMLAGESRMRDGRVQVLHAGAWLDVYATDLKDDIGTWSQSDTIEGYRAAAVGCYGGRLRDGGLGVVTQFSDG